MKICIENLNAIIEKYQALLISMANRFPIFDKNEAYIMARDMVFDIVLDFDPDKGSFGGYLKYRLYFYFLNECKKERVDSLNDKDRKGIEIIEKLRIEILWKMNLLKILKLMSFIRLLKLWKNRKGKFCI